MTARFYFLGSFKFPYYNNGNCQIVFSESPNVVVDLDGLKVRPNHTRCTVILREIPDDTQIHEIEVTILVAIE
jgi:hypothetical protein